MPPSMKRPAADAARDRMQHGEAEDGVGDQQARGEHAADDADEAGQERGRDRDARVSAGAIGGNRIAGRSGQRPLQPAGDLHDARGEPEIERGW